MHREILDESQVKLLSLLKLFRKQFFLVGGTAIALHIGHRRSIDFDLFTSGRINKKKIYENLLKMGLRPERELVSSDLEWTILIQSVKWTFYSYPYKIPAPISFASFARIPKLLDLAAMKAHALGRRGKWKDYVDLYFIFKDHASFDHVVQRAKRIFGAEFNEKLFRQQLSFYRDVDFSEEVEFVKKPVPRKTIERFLTDIAVS